MGIDIGISDNGRKKISDGLAVFLADNYVLYLKTQNFHWNVTGPLFQSLHEMFEQQYTDLATAVDEIAERIRAVGHFAPGSFTQFMEISNIKDQVESLRQLKTWWPYWSKTMSSWWPERERFWKLLMQNMTM